MAQGDIDASLRSALESEATNAWQESATRRAKGEITGKKEIRGVLPKRPDGSSQDDLVVLREVRVARDAMRHQMLAIGRPPGYAEGGGAWEVRNEKYAFSTTRKSDKDLFVLEKVRTSSDPDRWESRRNRYFDAFDVPHSLEFCRLWEFLEPSLFRLKSCRWIAGDSDPKKFAEVTYVCLSSPSILKLEVGAEYTLLLEPNLGWRLKHAEVKGGSRSLHMTWDVTYADGTAEQSEPTEIKKTIRVIGQEGFDVETYSFGPLKQLTFKDQDFRLSGYGFPDSTVDVPVTGRWFRILAVLGAFLLLVIGFLFFFRMDRGRQPRRT